MTMDWKECCSKRLAKKVEPDHELASSLIELSGGKYFTASNIKIEDKTAPSSVSLFYDALREILEAIAIKKGYKIYNHECYTWFLKEIMKEDELASGFDRVRKIRNGINYYGKKIPVDDAVDTVKDIKKLITKAKRLF
ncbi:MAG: hypothetical protein ABIB71_03915 [Candidatus Woesearchaeota archaeon]